MSLVLGFMHVPLAQTSFSLLFVLSVVVHLFYRWRAKLDTRAIADAERHLADARKIQSLGTELASGGPTRARVDTSGRDEVTRDEDEDEASSSEGGRRAASTR